MERSKNEEDQIVVDVADQIEDLKFVLAFICTYVQLSYSDLEEFEDRIAAFREQAEVLLRPVHNVLPSLVDKIDDCINSCHRSKSSATLTDEQLNFLLMNLHHLSKYVAEQVFPSVTEYEILPKVCGNVRYSHGLIVINGCIKHEITKNVIPRFQLMAERVGHFLWDGLHRENFRIPELAHLFLKIIPIELEVMLICYTNLKTSPSPEVGHFIKKLLETSPDILREYLIHLQEHMITVTTPSTLGAQNMHVMIEFLLIILTDMPKDFIHHDKLFDLLARVGVLTREVSNLVCDLEAKSRNKQTSDETNRATLDLLENIEFLKEDLKRVYLKAPDSSQICFPVSDGQLFMHLLLIHLNDLLDSNSYSIALIKEEIRLMKEDLDFIRSSFANIEQELYKDLWERVLDVAYEAKDVIDSIIDRDNGLLHLIFSLPLAIKKIKHIKEKVFDLHEKIPKNRSLIVVNSPNKLIESKSPRTDKLIVGFEEETNWIITKLIDGHKDLDVISITGMPGLGKTTLAYKVYSDQSVSSRFDIHAWCTVGQEYDEKNLLENVYNQVAGSDSKFSEDIDVVDELRKQLFGKRYLIVLDDLWDTTTWDELIRPFPKDKKGSRIILTTREMDVALYGMRNTDPLKLRLLKPEETWELLKKRAFGNESCPDELLDVGKEIAQNCKGLPLMADMIAGVLTGLEKKQTVWLEVLNNLSSFILDSEEDQVMKVIELSYDHLPVHLKPFFLYFSRFRKDAAIRVGVLINYWRAEGLADRTEIKSVEEVMQVYLDNLISSSLVILFNEIGDLSTCQLHDLVHDFCLKKAREEKFYDLISSSGLSSSSDSMPRMVTIKYDKVLFVLFGSKKKRRIGKHLYSLRITGGKLDDNLSYIRHLRLLRVLYLDDSFIIVKDSLLNEICMLNHLRFLRIRTEVKSLPLSFSNLSNLETLEVNNKGSTLVLLPRIWDLIKLRVLSVDLCSFFDMDTNEPILIAEDTKLEKLRLLENLVLSYSNDTKDIFKRFPNLQELIISLKESWDYSTEGYWFPKLDFLTELEFLRVDFKSSNTKDSGAPVKTNWSLDFHLPSNLKLLELNDFPLTSDSLSTIGRLPNLEMLSLIRTIIQGGEWNMGEEGTFEKLKCLNLYEVNLAKWEVGEESFPMLEKLELSECHKLNEIPSSFRDICSLKIIKLVENPQLEYSAKNIQIFVEDMGGELQILGLNDIPVI